MRTIEADIGHSGELHKLFLEYCADREKRVPSPEMWLRKFADPSFFCLLAKHGKKQIGFVMGRIHPYYDEPVAEIETVFVRRAFRGKIKWTRGIVGGVKDFLSQLKIGTIEYSRTKPRERSI